MPAKISPPLLRPNSPLFGSGPTKKFPGWAWENLQAALLGRSHRSADGHQRLQDLINLTRSVLEIPADYQIAVIPGSATGAMETALWTLLGNRGVDVFSWDVFGKLWVTDVVQQLKISEKRIFEADFGKIPDLSFYNPSNDVVFTWNATTSGVSIPNLDWIPTAHQGLVICDATSAAFTVDLGWKKLDATAFSWQKGLGGEAAHGMLVLSPKALQHLENYDPPWPIPRLFRLKKDNQFLDGIFTGKTINTPSMLCVEDCLAALLWAESIGGQQSLIEKTQQNFKVIDSWLQHHPLLENLALNPQTKSKSSVCFKLRDEVILPPQQLEVIVNVTKLLSEKRIAFEIKNHYLAPSSFRIWCGPTIEKSDLVALLPWIDWALENSI